LLAFTANAKFSTKSVYYWLEKDLAGSNNKWIWKTKIPLKIKIFMWQLCRDALLTRENMKKRQCLGRLFILFAILWKQIITCSSHALLLNVSGGTLGHVLGAQCVPNNFRQAMAWLHAFMRRDSELFLVVIAAFCWAIWNIRNKVIFEHHKLRSPNEIVYFTVSLMRYWAGLHKDDDKAILNGGADKLARLASEIFIARHQAGQPLLMITGA
jgi:hypothetical protein